MINSQRQIGSHSFPDGFAIVITKDGKENRTYFDQEDTRKDLVKVFKDLGHKNVSYREVY